MKLRTTFEKLLKKYLTKSQMNSTAHEPLRIIEVGSWIGASTSTMAQRCRVIASPRQCQLLAIDAWLGAPIVYTDEKAVIHKELKAGGGNLQLYQQFLKTVILHNLTDIITPFRLPSAGAAHVLNCFGIKADMVYIDGDHEYDGVKADLAAYFPIVKEGGLFFGDDGQNSQVSYALKEWISKQKMQMELSKEDRRTWVIWN